MRNHARLVSEVLFTSTFIIVLAVITLVPIVMTGPRSAGEVDMYRNFRIIGIGPIICSIHLARRVESGSIALPPIIASVALLIAIQSLAMSNAVLSVTFLIVASFSFALSIGMLLYRSFVDRQLEVPTPDAE